MRREGEEDEGKEDEVRSACWMMMMITAST